ncbi:MAG TPA: HD domain-containing protein [Candidatus Limnocylindria bacterium]|nr:HD domain-containing protein [Candidatus Limnocylindria bacterium]
MNQTKLNGLGRDMRFEGYLLVKSSEKRVNRNGDPYLDINLADNTRDINAKVWNSDETPPAPGQVVKVRGLVVEYNNRLQMKVERLRPVDGTDEVDLSQLVPAAPRASDEMMGEVNALVDGMANPVLKALCAEMLKRAEEKILYYPAAQSMHHAERSGLLHHLTDMLKAARAICACYPYLDEDLVVAGVIVHDLGKLTEMNASELGSVTDYSREGLLLGHIVTGVSALRDAAKALGFREDDEYPLLLSHMILSHHGIPEYGSPRPPMFPEAEVLNWLDVLDSRLNEMRSAMLRGKPGSFTERIPALDRRLYYPKYQNDPFAQEAQDVAEMEDEPEAAGREPVRGTPYENGSRGYSGLLRE